MIRKSGYRFSEKIRAMLLSMSRLLSEGGPTQHRRNRHHLRVSDHAPDRSTTASRCGSCVRAITSSAFCPEIDAQ
jgi:hypothetical protein